MKKVLCRSQIVAAWQEEEGEDKEEEEEGRGHGFDDQYFPRRVLVYSPIEDQFL